MEQVTSHGFNRGMNQLRSPQPGGGAIGEAGMTSIQANGPGDRAAASHGDPRRLRPTALGLLMFLLVQFALGMVVNLYVRVPAGRAGYGPAVAALVLHGLVGLALIAGSVSLAVRAVAARVRQAAVPAVTAAVVLLVAAAGGLRFLGTGVDGASLVMALCAAIAIGCYSLILYWLPGAGPVTPPAAGR
jgi:hypothetical protein